MPVYQIIDLDVHNTELYARYTAQVAGLVRQYGGQYLARGGQVTPLSGHWQPGRIVILKFESLEQLQACYASPAYRAIAPLREQSAVSRSIVVDGYLPPE
jgi:uncharacterized protein (DUF1330 family)